MSPKLALALRVTVTLLLAFLALLAAREMWQRYEVDPWTRDGKVRADVVRVASDVPGLVTRLMVRENEPVSRGQPLFEVDAPRYRLALAQANAAVASARAALTEANSETARDVALGDLVSQEARDQSRTKAESAAAMLEAARAAVDVAALNLSRTLVRSPIDGQVANLQLRVGDYVAAGTQALALVDARSVWVEGYFEETKLPRIHIGDPAKVMLMGETQPIEGRVESIAPGIDDRDRSAASNQLASINPTFNWVRLAQRVPVRITLLKVPKGINLIAGRTATVTVGAALAGLNGSLP